MTRIILAILIAFGISGCGGGGSGNVPRSDGFENLEELSVSYSQMPDSSALSASYLVSYLRSDADDDYENSGGELAGSIQKYERPPTVRVAADTPPVLVDQVANVVREINAALPNNWQLTFSSTPAPRQPDHTIEPPAGEIHVQFSSRTEWGIFQDAAGFSQIVYQCVDFSCERYSILSGRAYIDPSISAGRIRERVIAHELLHTLGRNHIDPARFPDTIMDPSESSTGSNKPILDPLDREALLAVYGRLSPGAPIEGIENDLGPWATDAMEIHGDLAITSANIQFGASTRNGRTQPWVKGPQPDIDIADNDQLNGSATFTGRLLGFTNDASTIGGRVGLSVRLATLDGDLSFTGLEIWQPGMAPGTPGTGTAFSSGASLNYVITIEGNTFVRIGGDVGAIDGSFFGGSHQGMGGTIHRDDFAGAFAGNR